MSEHVCAQPDAVAVSSPPVPAPPAPMPREIYVLALVALIVALGFGIVGPAIPLLAESFGVGKAIAATAISAFALCRLASAFVHGRLVERFGEHRLLGVGLAVQSITLIIAGASPNFTLVVVFRAVGGFGSAAFTVAAMSLLLRLAPPEQRARAASLYQGGFLLGAIGGPAIGGFLAEISPRVPFFVYGVALAAAGTVGLVMLRERPSAPVAAVLVAQTPAVLDHGDEGVADVASVEQALTTDRSDEPPGTTLHTLREALRSRAYLACLVVNLGVGWMLYGVRNSLLPVYVTEDLHRSVSWAGVAFLVSSAAQAIVLLRAARFADAKGRRPVLVLGGVLGTVSVGMLVFPPHWTVFLAAMIVFGAAGGLLASAPAAVLADVTGGGGGRLVAVFQMAADFGGVIGPLVAGVLTDAFSYQAAFAMGTVVMAAGLVFAIAMPETSRRPAPR